MKATVNVMKRLAKNLENTSFICSSDVRLTIDDNDCIVASMRYEDGNSYTIVCHLFEDDVQIGYFLSDGTYKWYATAMLKSFKDTADFLFYMGIKLKEVSEYIEKYVIDTDTTEKTLEQPATSEPAETPEPTETHETNESEVNKMKKYRVYSTLKGINPTGLETIFEADNENHAINIALNTWRRSGFLTSKRETVAEVITNGMYINNKYRVEYFDTDLGIWVTIDDLTDMSADNELEAIEAAVDYMAYSDYEAGNGDDIDDLKAIWHNTPWRAAQEINPEYNADYNWKYE